MWKSHYLSIIYLILFPAIPWFICDFMFSVLVAHSIFSVLRDVVKIMWEPGWRAKIKAVACLSLLLAQLIFVQNPWDTYCFILTFGCLIVWFGLTSRRAVGRLNPSHGIVRGLAALGLRVHKPVVTVDPHQPFSHPKTIEAILKTDSGEG